MFEPGFHDLITLLWDIFSQNDDNIDGGFDWRQQFGSNSLKADESKLICN